MGIRKICRAKCRNFVLFYFVFVRNLGCIGRLMENIYKGGKE